MRPSDLPKVTQMANGGCRTGSQISQCLGHCIPCTMPHAPPAEGRKVYKHSCKPVPVLDNPAMVFLAPETRLDRSKDKAEE